MIILSNIKCVCIVTSFDSISIDLKRKKKIHETIGILCARISLFGKIN